MQSKSKSKSQLFTGVLCAFAITDAAVVAVEAGTWSWSAPLDISPGAVVSMSNRIMAVCPNNVASQLVCGKAGAGPPPSLPVPSFLLHCKS